jgi:hypothetical protein
MTGTVVREWLWGSWWSEDRNGRIKEIGQSPACSLVFDSTISPDGVFPNVRLMYFRTAILSPGGDFPR